MGIRYCSTNRSAPHVGFREAILRGQAPDYGLYLPVSFPRIPPALIASLREMPYHEVARAVIEPFAAEDVAAAELAAMCADAYSFDVPLERVAESLFILRLDRGPTASFKDFAARLMARLVGHFAREKGARLTVLVATSGDTGGAVADAFFRVPGVSVIVLFPEREVTVLQRRQMTTLGENVTAMAVPGKFDDCQALVKRAFNDPALARMRLTSANSINLGRLLPQAVYYLYAWSRIGGDAAPVFSVPCGNFGNLLGGIFAREMGLPVRRFIAAVNENDEFPRFLETGRYEPVVPSRECTSNAMNVGHPSNLARLVALYGGWLTDERDAEGRVTRAGVMLAEPDVARLRRDFLSFSVSDAEARETIRTYAERHGVLLEPHGAVAVAAAERSGVAGPVVCLETADPAKFPEEIAAATGREPPVPPRLAALEGKRESFNVISPDYGGFRAALLRLG